MHDDYDYQERAAILEFEAGQPRGNSFRRTGAWIIALSDHSIVPAGKRSAQSSVRRRQMMAIRAIRLKGTILVPNIEHRQPAGRPGKAGVPYGVVAARASTGYLNFRETWQKLQSTKGATP